jgi:putative intracellular protease/amidase
MAAGGLWTTPSNLATIAVEVALSKHGKSNRLHSQSMTREMLRRQVERVGEFALGNEQHPDAMGLGFFLGDKAHSDLFGHIGDDAGFQAMLMMFSDSGQGVAIMANSEIGLLLGDYLTENIAKEYGWEGYVRPNRPRIGATAALLALVRSKGIDTATKAYREFKKASDPRSVPDRESLISLVYRLAEEKKLQDALAVAKLEVEEFPYYWNAFDTLGEMYMNAGEKRLAIQNYERSIELNPKNENGLRMLKTLNAATVDAGASRPAGGKVYVCPPCGNDCDKLTFDKPGVCPHCGMTLVEMTDSKPSRRRNVAIVIFNQMELLDFAGPAEVFAAAGGGTAFKVYTVAESDRPIKSQGFVTITPQYTIANCPRPDILVIPGGNTTSVSRSPKMLDWVKEISRDGERVLSVCTGAFVLARAGLLDGLQATTHHGSIDRLRRNHLRRNHPKVTVRTDVRVVDNGKILTAAGVSAGIDGALHIVSKICGAKVAQKTAEYMEYTWHAETAAATGGAGR